MKEFEDLQNLWDKQQDANVSVPSEELIKKAGSVIKKVQRNHLWTIAVLCTTTAVLITYFFWFSIYKLELFALGIGIMAATLILRSAVEWWSRVKLNEVKPDLPLLHYTERLQNFYTWRKKIHYILTPVIFVLYFTGFVIALPELEPYVSRGMFWYIIVSGTLCCIGFAFYIRREARREIETLEYLKGIR